MSTQDIINHLPHIHLTDNDDQLFSTSSQRHFHAGDTIFRKDDPATHFYIVDKGCVEIHSMGVIFDLLGSGEGFGEMALFVDQYHHVTAIAQQETTVTCIPVETLAELSEIMPELRSKLFEQMRHNLRLNLLASALSQTIGTIEKDVFRDLADTFTWQTYQPGDTIFSQGDSGEEMFILLTGRVRVESEANSNQQVLHELGRGTMFGELALLNDAPRSATITAIRETTVVAITHQMFDQWLEEYTTFARRILALIAQRQQNNTPEQLYQQATPMSFALIQGQEDVDMSAVIDSLFPYLSQHGRAIVLDEQRFNHHYGTSTGLSQIPPIVKQRWISDLEESHDYIFFVITDPCNEWASWVASNADRVVIIDEAHNTPQPDALKQCIRTEAIYQQYELLLLHAPDVEQPTGTATWLDAYNVIRHHHIRRGDEGHFARVARLLTGNGIGFVLGGGGARGYVHVGVLKALIEADVPIDAVGCVSMGAVIGGAYLSGIHTEDVISKIIDDGKNYGSKKALLDATVPISAMMRSKKVSVAMQGVCGDMNIEDGWIPFFCLSTNLTKQCINIHKQGKLHQAVRASLSIPGIFTPVVRDGDLLVDGGVMNNFPVTIMREFLEGGTIIGTLVEHTGNQRVYEIEDEIDGTQALLSRIVPGMKQKRVPSILKTIMAASSVNAYARQAEYRQQVDFLLETDTAPYSTMDFDNVWELFERGFETHRDAAQEWAQANQSLLQ